jgi:hypothetical protein
MKASIILRRVKERMLPREYPSRFICDNVWCVAESRADEKRITKFIHKLLGGKFSLVEWLIDHGHVEADSDGWSYDNTNYIGDIDHIKLKATRMAWLDYLIAHYESKGD